MADKTLHWHRSGTDPSSPANVPDCCEAVLDRLVDEATHAERRRVILDTAAEITRYTDAAASVLDTTGRALVRTVAAKAVEAIKQRGCICPRIDTTTLGEIGPTWTLGGDNRCGMHTPSTKEQL